MSITNSKMNGEINSKMNGEEKVDVNINPANKETIFITKSDSDCFKNEMMNEIRVANFVQTNENMFSLISKAKVNNNDYIIVMTNRCSIIDKKLEMKFQRIIGYLKLNMDKWDIFNFCPVDKVSDVKVEYPYPIIVSHDYEDDKMKMSHSDLKYVFTVYNKSSYDKIISGDNNLKTFTSYPLLVKNQIYQDVEINNSIIYKSIEKKQINCKLIGGLGNQLFIFLTAFVTAIKYKRVLSFPKKNYIPCKFRKTNEYWNTFFKFLDLSVPYTNSTVVIGQRDGFVYDNITIDPNHQKFEKVMLSGYYQNAKYFEGYKEDIRNLLQLNYETIQYFQQKYSNVLFNTTPENINKRKVMVHVRRGDYLKLSHYHTVQPLSYYKRCLNNVRHKYPNCVVTVFSDDIKWCVDNI